MKKLTKDDVELIRQLLDEQTFHRKKAKELSYDNIAKKFDVSRTTIHNIRYHLSHN